MSHDAMSYVAAGAVIVHIVSGQLFAAFPGSRSRDARIRWAVASGCAARHLVGGSPCHGRHGGQTIPSLRKVSVLAPRSGQGPQGVAGTVRDRRRRAAQPAVTGLPVDGDERCDDAGVHRRGTGRDAAGDDRLPIACVEGWSADAEWTVSCLPIYAAVGASRDSDVRIISLEPSRRHWRTASPARHARDGKTSIALKLNGQTLDLITAIPAG